MAAAEIVLTAAGATAAFTLAAGWGAYLFTNRSIVLRDPALIVGSALSLVLYAGSLLCFFMALR